MPKLYTKTGDKGITSLYDGNLLPKHSIFFQVLGDIDELSSHIGLLHSYISNSKEDDYHLDSLRQIQVTLLDIGSNIAVIDPDKKQSVPKITDENVKNIEDLIDQCEYQNKKLTDFLLPGVKITDAQCHVCRSVTRRAERSLWELRNNENDVDPNILKYMNRLSDFFFALSRNLSGGEDVKVGLIKKSLI